MSVVFIPGGAPSYDILSTDITAGSTVTGVSYIGAIVNVLDTGKTYKVLPDLTLIEYSLPVSSEGSSGSSTVLGTVIVSAMPPLTGDVTISGSVNILSGSVNTNENWRISLLTSTSAVLGSDKRFVVPPNTEYQIFWISNTYTSCSVVGNRQLVIQVLDSGSNVLSNWARAGNTSASGIIRNYLFAPGVADFLSFRDTDYFTTPIPSTSFLSTGQQIRIYDNKAIAAAADGMNIQMQIASRTV